MAHNLRRRAARDAVLATPLEQNATCILAASCPSCRERRELRIECLLTNANPNELWIASDPNAVRHLPKPAGDGPAAKKGRVGEAEPEDPAHRFRRGVSRSNSSTAAMAVRITTSMSIAN
jgi:hypothetical protein